MIVSLEEKNRSLKGELLPYLERRFILSVSAELGVSAKDVID